MTSKEMEARPGVEPRFTDLQSAAWPLCQRASEVKRRICFVAYAAYFTDYANWVKQKNEMPDRLLRFSAICSTDRRKQTNLFSSDLKQQWRWRPATSRRWVWSIQVTTSSLAAQPSSDDSSSSDQTYSSTAGCRILIGLWHENGFCAF